jgi:Transglycosylase-like domain
MAMKRLTILISCCALAGSTAAMAAGQVPAQTPSGGAGASEPAAAQQPAKPASRQLVRAYLRWRHRLNRYGAWTGRNLLHAEAASGTPTRPTSRQLRHSIHRMQRRFYAFLRTPHGRAVKFRLRSAHIPGWGRQKLASIAACESHGNPRAIGGGGAYRGMYQFSFSTWRVVGGYGDPAAAPASEQTWRAWLLLSRHGSGHWPVCG